MTRMLSVGLGRERRRCRCPASSTIAAFAATATSRDERERERRIRAAGARSRAAARATSERREADGQRARGTTRSARSGRSARGGRTDGQVRTAAAIAKITVDEDPEQAKHARDSMSAVWEIGRRQARRAAAAPDRARYARRMPDTRRFEGPSDLHLHSSTPTAPNRRRRSWPAAHRHGLRTAALTDHDTTSGWAEAAEAAASLGMTFIPGHGTVRQARVAQRPCAGLPVRPRRRGPARDDRPHPRHRAWIGRASMADASAATTTWTGTTSSPRPRTAPRSAARTSPTRWSRKGHVRDRAEAFAGILQPARRLLRRAVRARSGDARCELVVGAGGVPIIAHPAGRAGAAADAAHGADARRRDSPASSSAIARTSRPASGRCARIVDERDLIVTGSSDYHGLGKPNQPGENTTSDDMVARIIDRGTGTAPRSTRDAKGPAAVRRDLRA